MVTVGGRKPIFVSGALFEVVHPLITLTLDLPWLSPYKGDMILVAALATLFTMLVLSLNMLARASAVTAASIFLFWVFLDLVLASLFHFLIPFPPIPFFNWLFVL